MAINDTVTLPRFIDERELSDILGISVKTIQRWRVLGIGPQFSKLGRGKAASVRYSVSDVGVWLGSLHTGGAGRRIDGAAARA